MRPDRAAPGGAAPSTVLGGAALPVLLRDGGPPSLRRRRLCLSHGTAMTAARHPLPHAGSLFLPPRVGRMALFSSLARWPMVGMARRCVFLLMNKVSLVIRIDGVQVYKGSLGFGIVIINQRNIVSLLGESVFGRRGWETFPGRRQRQFIAESSLVSLAFQLSIASVLGFTPLLTPHRPRSRHNTLLSLSQSVWFD